MQIGPDEYFIRRAFQIAEERALSSVAGVAEILSAEGCPNAAELLSTAWVRDEIALIGLVRKVYASR